jgi:hypothetical protein
MNENFNPIKGERGEFRVALNLSELGERAWEILALSQEVGFPAPQFKTHVRYSGAIEVWAVLVQQFHSYDAFTDPILAEWDDVIDRLDRAIGQDSHLKLITLFNFREHLEQDVA